MVAMATGIIRGYIYMTTLDCPTPKIKGKCKRPAIIFYGDRVIGYRFEISIGCNAKFCNF